MPALSTPMRTPERGKPYALVRRAPYSYIQIRPLLKLELSRSRKSWNFPASQSLGSAAPEDTSLIKLRRLVYGRSTSSMESGLGDTTRLGLLGQPRQLSSNAAS